MAANICHAISTLISNSSVKFVLPVVLFEYFNLNCKAPRAFETIIIVYFSTGQNRIKAKFLDRGLNWKRQLGRIPYPHIGPPPRSRLSRRLMTGVEKFSCTSRARDWFIPDDLWKHASCDRLSRTASLSRLRSSWRMARKKFARGRPSKSCRWGFVPLPP